MCKYSILTMTDATTLSHRNEYVCKKCDYICSRLCDYNKHCQTIKHNTDTDTDVKRRTPTEYVCQCGKSYKHRQSLHTHKKQCSFDNLPTPTPTPISHLVDATLVIELLKQNQEFKELMMEQSKQLAGQQNILLEAVKDGKLGNTNTNCNNTTNNKFNLNVFLNETCKDAISMDDFIKSFEVTRDEFLHTGKVGYIEGLSAVIANRFRDMDVHTRPLHCTDLKRETIYIKNADKWEKDDAEKTNMRKAVRGVARKNKQEMWRWYDENKPDVEQIGTDVCEDYFQYHRSTLGGYGKEEDLKFEDKIIHNVLKGVHVTKSTALTI
jgi:hypothetical protein